jgi:glycosyltransferase involved in cell wall biosynthesis
MIIPRATHAAPIMGLYTEGLTQAFYRLFVPLETAYGHERVTVTDLGIATEAQFKAARLIVTSRLVGRVGTLEGREGGRRFVDMLRMYGARVVMDLDDDFTDLPPPWKAPRERVAMTEGMLGAVDGIVCTNETLAKRLRSYGPPVTVIPNYVRPDLWPQGRRPAPARETWLLLAGSRSHLQDWKEAAPAIRRLKQRYPALRLRVICHYLFDYLAPLVDDFIPWVPADRYPQALAGNHIALCPLPPSKFNVCKSPVKALEAALAGCAVIGSETQYGPLLRAAGLPHAVATPRTWETAIARYLDDPDTRSAEAAQLRRYVTDRLDARHHVEAIRAAYAAHQEHIYV